ncbi:hypothetical protein JXA32_04805 [Candidatus Sumerlaeota bacterium]|nr:hypothetical protein [Candidatus Sumerlaeota bacterium]
MNRSISTQLAKRMLLEAFEQFMELLQLYIEPDKRIPNLGKNPKWSAPLGALIAYVLLLPTTVTLLVSRKLPEAASFIEISVFYISLPFFLFIFTYCGLRILFHAQTTLALCANTVAATLFPFIVGHLLMEFFFVLEPFAGQTCIYAGWAAIIFTIFFSFRCYVELIRWIHDLERLKRIYFAPAIFSLSIFCTLLTIEVVLKIKH